MQGRNAGVGTIYNVKCSNDYSNMTGRKSGGVWYYFLLFKVQKSDDPNSRHLKISLMHPSKYTRLRHVCHVDEYIVGRMAV